MREGVPPRRAAGRRLRPCSRSQAFAVELLQHPVRSQRSDRFRIGAQHLHHVVGDSAGRRGSAPAACRWSDRPRAATRSASGHRCVADAQVLEAGLGDGRRGLRDGRAPQPNSVRNAAAAMQNVAIKRFIESGVSLGLRLASEATADPAPASGSPSPLRAGQPWRPSRWRPRAFGHTLGTGRPVQAATELEKQTHGKPHEHRPDHHRAAGARRHRRFFLVEQYELSQ